MFVCRVGRNYNCDKATNQYEYNGHLQYIMILISVLIMVILFFIVGILLRSILYKYNITY